MLAGSPLLATLAFVGVIAILIRVTDLMVDAVFAIADHFSLPGAITGALLAAMATSAPELGTNLAASIGVGVIVGSQSLTAVTVIATWALCAVTLVCLGMLARTQRVNRRLSWFLVAVYASFALGVAGVARGAL